MSRSAMAREALKVLGQAASNEELVNVNRDAKRYGSLSRLSVVAQAAEQKAAR